jgi:hypothetical protein
MAEKLYTEAEVLAIVKDKLREQLEKGAPCPVCTQFCKIYKRKIYSTPARGLLQLYKLTEAENEEYFHITRIEALNRSGGGDFAKLTYWGLVEEKPKEDDDETTGRTSGFWKITDLGRMFARNEVTVPSHVKLYDGRKLGFTTGRVGIKEVLGKNFDYEELMSE